MSETNVATAQYTHRTIAIVSSLYWCKRETQEKLLKHRTYTMKPLSEYKSNSVVIRRVKIQYGIKKDIERNSHCAYDRTG